MQDIVGRALSGLRKIDCAGQSCAALLLQELRHDHHVVDHRIAAGLMLAPQAQHMIAQVFPH
jgi:hypothetical protein